MKNFFKTIFKLLFEDSKDTVRKIGMNEATINRIRQIRDMGTIGTRPQSHSQFKEWAKNKKFYN